MDKQTAARFGIEGVKKNLREISESIEAICKNIDVLSVRLALTEKGCETDIQTFDKLIKDLEFEIHSLTQARDINKHFNALYNRFNQKDMKSKLPSSVDLHYTLTILDLDSGKTGRLVSYDVKTDFDSSYHYIGPQAELSFLGDDGISYDLKYAHNPDEPKYLILNEQGIKVGAI